MGFKFSLQKLLEARKVTEELAQRDFQEAQAQLIEQENLLSKMKSEIQLARLQSISIQKHTGTHAQELQVIHNFIIGQEIRIQQQKRVIQVGQALVEERRELLRQAAIEYKIIEKLREKKLNEFLEETRIRELRELDEISVMRHKHGVKW